MNLGIRMTPHSRMENSIDKSRRNATEKSDKFQLVLKEQERNLALNFSFKIPIYHITSFVLLYKLKPLKGKERLHAFSKKETNYSAIKCLTKQVTN